MWFNFMQTSSQKVFHSRRGSPQALVLPALLAGLIASGLALKAAEKLSLPPETATFKNGPGVEIALAQCVLCHSADYVSTQPRLPRAGWKASVQKMRDKYGAPLPENQIEPLTDYLVRAYGTNITVKP
jgi:mono/diheme cytochrome c family protein